MAHIERTLRSGATVRAAPEHMATVLAIEERMQQEETSWVQALRDAGVKAAHPDDGWVKRNPDRSGHVHLEYPQFKDGALEVGDLIALGWPGQSWETPMARTRIVRVTKVGDPPEHFAFRSMIDYHFEQVDPDPRAMAQMPASEVPRPCWLLRLFGMRGV